MHNEMTVVVKRSQLLEEIKQNRDDHASVYWDAMKEYKAQMILMLEETIEDIRNDIYPDRYIGLPIPENHINDYDRVISMLQMDVREEFPITADQYDKYVLDNWDWKNQWEGSTLSYISS